jgi:predicted amidohydrolase YtcJ
MRVGANTDEAGGQGVCEREDLDGDEKKPQAEALAIRGDKIVAVGTAEEVKKVAGANAAVVDLHGRLVVPGFQDSHAHWPGVL